MNVIFTLHLVVALFQSPPFLPENDLHLSDSLRMRADLTEDEFLKITNDIANFYRPLIESHGARLFVNADWRDSTVNAYAQQTGDTWEIKMFGGLARRSEITADGYALVVCHELGHHLGGFPFYTGEWAASEGQADYFATQICLRNAWRHDLETNARFRDTAHSTVKSKCDQVWTTSLEQDLCYRVGMAGVSTAKLMAALGQTPADVDSHDPSVVKETYLRHPAAQCRMDTYLAGALCSTPFDDRVIPGKNHVDGQNSLPAEIVADSYSCARADLLSVGSRPRCWFAPQRLPALKIGQLDWTEIVGNGDLEPEPGEIWTVLTEISNQGVRSFESSRLKLSSPSRSVEVLSAQAPIGSLSVGETTSPHQAFVVRIHEETACHEALPIAVEFHRPHGWEPVGEHKIELGEIQRVEASQAQAEEIPDANPAGIQSIIDVQASASAHKLEVSVDITHPWIGDLTVKLISPSGEDIVLHAKTDGSADDIKKTFVFDRFFENVGGLWTLHVDDSVGTDKGILNHWSLNFKRHECR